MKNDTFDNRLSLARLKARIPDDKLKMGSTKDKYPILLNDGRTTIFISDKSKEDETRLKYELIMKSKFPAPVVKFHS
jgi:hypothetical protein